MIKYIFFDVGGTLCGSSKNLDDKPSFKRILSTYTHRPPSYFNVKKQKYLWTSTGPKIDLISRLCQDLKIDDYKSLHRKLSEHAYKVNLYKDVKPVLEKLSKEYQLGLLSNTTIWTAFDHNMLGIGEYVKISILSCKVGVTKPDIGIFNHAQKAVALKPDELLYVGDHVEYDIKPALNAGWKAVLLNRNKKPQKSPAPVISNLYELESILKKIKYENQ